MHRVFMIMVFAFSLFLKVATSAGAEGEFKPGKLLAKKVTTTTTEVTNDDEEAEADNQEQSSKIQNNINVNHTAPNAYQDASSVLGAKVYAAPTTERIAIIAMIGASAYNGRWYDHVSNSYSLGLALDIPASNHFSIELEGGYGRYNVSYGYYAHDFNQYNAGASGKYYLSRSVIQPYIGLGMMALNYDNMTYGPTSFQQRYNRWIGAVQAMAGLDVEVSPLISVGVRGAWLVPVINRPSVASSGPYAMPYYEEASLMNNTQMKFLGTARFAF